MTAAGKHLVLIAVSLLATVTLARAEEAPRNNGASEQATVFLIDDQTGEELLQKHGIRPIAIEALDVLINGVVNGHTPVRLFHQAVDEDAADNATAQMEFRPYAGEKPVKKVAINLPLPQLIEANKAYAAKRTAWQKGVRDYQLRLAGEVEGFIRQVTETQGSVSERFDNMLLVRNGRDFNRSDIYGCVANASRLLGTQGRRFLVLNTDAIDLPGKRKPRTTPLNAKELDPAVELIFVNTSRLPEQAPMFTGLPNPRHHANSMKEAMELVVELVTPKPVNEASAGERK